MRAIIVIESFPRPRPTTNPYIAQLAGVLEADDRIELKYFSYREAILGRYDLFHIHWPEVLIGGHRVIGRWARRGLAALLLVRLGVSRTPIVRTVHNVERPTGLGRIDHLLLSGFDRLTAFRIRLNTETDIPDDRTGTTILHGHYQDWFEKRPIQPSVEGRVSYVGLVRRYKGIETLIAAVKSSSDSSLRLTVAGAPSSPSLAAQLVELAAPDPRITFDMRFLNDDAFVAAVTAAELVVLPYRHMHNSGTALATLSLGRPVLVPDTAVNRNLSREVGDGWVWTFAGDLTASDLEHTLARVRTSRFSVAPDLHLRGWSDVGDAHVRVFAAAQSAPGRSFRRRGRRELT